MKMVLKSNLGDLKRTTNSKYYEKYIRFKSVKDILHRQKLRN
jgi:septin family protein